MRLSQIAISVADLKRAQGWYREVLGLEPAGGTSLFAGPLAAMVQGVPRAASTCWWLVDRQELFQLELFEFRSPLVRSRPPDWRPCDIGYTMIAFAVDDLDLAIRRATSAGSAPLTDPLGSPGERRVCVRDPDGVLIELLEEDPRAGRPRPRPRRGVPAAARSVTLSVPDLERSRAVFEGVLGLEVAGAGWHRPEHEELWGLAGAERESVALWADDMIVELVQYTGSAGQAVAARVQGLGPGAPEHRLRVQRQGRVRERPATLRGGGPACKRPPRPLRGLVGGLRQRRAGIQRRAAPCRALVRRQDGVSGPGRTPSSRPSWDERRRGAAGAAVPTALITGAAGWPRRGARPPGSRGRHATSS